MKILYVTTIGITMTFFKHLIKELMDEGHIVDIMCNEDDEKVPECYREWECKIYHHSCSRSPLAKGNLQAIGQIKKLVSENQYDIVHCHTPVAAMCTRVACRGLRKHGVKVMYTAHGFHFYKGAPKLNWLIYYPIEKICSYWTDVLITINSEDYELAQRKMKAKRVEYVPGVGIDVEKFRNTVVDRNEKRRELGIPEDAFLLISVGELNANKNHEIVIRALATLKNKKIYYAIVGKGPLETFLKKLSREVSVIDNIYFLGYRKDVLEIYKSADVCVMPSIREGLPVALVEAMACALPVIVSANRGSNDCVKNYFKAIVCKFDSEKEFADAINLTYQNYNEDTSEMNTNENISVRFDIKVILREMRRIYGVEI